MKAPCAFLSESEGAAVTGCDRAFVELLVASVSRVRVGIEVELDRGLIDYFDA